MHELMEKKKIEEYQEKMEKEKRLKEEEEEIEREKVRECQQALEREKIAKGMQSTREDEVILRRMQLMQVEERQMIESEEKERDRMWHQALVDTVRNKEYQELLESQRRHHEMRIRRKAYDEQIASANRRRQEVIRIERERENRRHEQIRRKIDMDREEEMKRKREQQKLNTKNYIEGHEMKLLRLHSERQMDRQADNQTIQIALDELRQERMREYLAMKKLQQEKRVFVENYNRERESAIRMTEESDQAAMAWQEVLDTRAAEHLRSVKEQKALEKEQEATAYRAHLEDLKINWRNQLEERTRRTDKVRQVATSELRYQLKKAHGELDKQMEYRNQLDYQMEENQKVMGSESRCTEDRLRPFTKRPQMFREAMRLKIDRSPGRNSTNPVHPFKRLLEIQGTKCEGGMARAI